MRTPLIIEPRLDRKRLKVSFKFLRKISHRKKLIFFDLCLSVCRPNDIFDYGFILRVDESKWYSNCFRHRRSKGMQNMCCLAAIHDLKVANNKSITRGLQKPSDHCDAVIHQY